MILQSCDNCGGSPIEVLGGGMKYCSDCDRVLCPRCFDEDICQCDDYHGDYEIDPEMGNYD